MRRLVVLRLAGALVVLAACTPVAPPPLQNTTVRTIAPRPVSGSAYFLSRSDNRGVLRLTGPRPAALAAAALVLADECGVDRFVILTDGEEDFEDTTFVRVHYECD
jgi:hypothetical protein